LEQGATECFLCGTAIASQEPEIAPEPEFEQTTVEEPEFEQTVVEEPEFEQTTVEEPEFEEIVTEESEFEQTKVEEPEFEQTTVEGPEFEQTVIEGSELEEFVCPMCGTGVSEDASECPGCGEPFSPLSNGEIEPEPEFYDETAFEETEEVEMLAPGEDGLEVPVETEYCQDCESPLSEDGSCPECSPPEKEDEARDGCPICGSQNFTVESGDLVSCADCGNVYIRKEFDGAEQSWKWKFWVGLVFIIIGDIGVALGSYVHNVFEWSPLGNMYLGYGWMDQLVGILGIVLFIVGLILFAWSFKRDREVQCPSCKVFVLENQLTEVEDEEEDEVPEELAVESALEEIVEAVECPSCGSEVSMFDTSCGNCGVLFEMEGDFDEEIIDSEEPMDEPPELEEPGQLLSASEIDEDEIIMESLELDGPEESVELNGNGLAVLDELESAFDMSMEEEVEVSNCPSCGAMVGKGLDTCPGCGASIGEGGE